MIDPDPKPGEVWEIRGLVDHEIAPRIMLIVAVYPTKVGDYPSAMDYIMVDGVVEGSMLSIGTGWLIRRLLDNEEQEDESR